MIGNYTKDIALKVSTDSVNEFNYFIDLYRLKKWKQKTQELLKLKKMTSNTVVYRQTRK